MDKFLTEMELVVPEDKKPDIKEPTANELEFLFINGETKMLIANDGFTNTRPKIERKDCRVEKSSKMSQRTPLTFSNKSGLQNP